MASIRKLEIVINPFSNKNNILENGEAIRPGSRLSNYLSGDVLHFAHEFYRTAGEYVNGNYELTITGEAFDCCLLAAFNANQEMPVKLNRGRFKINTPLKSRLESLEALATSVKAQVPPNVKKIRIYSEVKADGIQKYATSSDLESADICIFSSEQTMNAKREKTNAYVCLYCSDKSCVSYNDYLEQYALGAKPDSVLSLLRSYIEKTVIAPRIVLLSNMILRYLKNRNSKEYRDLLLATSIDEVITIDSIGQLEVGQTVKPHIQVFPADSRVPELFLESSDRNVVDVVNGCFTAKNAGLVTLSVYRKDDSNACWDENIKVVATYYAKSIRFQNNNVVTGIGHKTQLKVTVLPNDADDARSITFTSSNPTIVGLENGNIVPKNAGSAVITAKGVRTSATLNVIVKPQIGFINPERTDVRMYSGNEIRIPVNYGPRDAYDTTITASSTNSNVATVRWGTGGIIIDGTGIGQATIVLKAKEGRTTSRVNIEVIPYRETGNNLLKASMAFGLFFNMVAIILLIIFGTRIEFPIAIIPAILAAMFGLISIIKHKDGKDIGWGITFMAVGLIISLLSIAIPLSTGTI